MYGGFEEASFCFRNGEPHSPVDHLKEGVALIRLRYCHCQSHESAASGTIPNDKSVG